MNTNKNQEVAVEPHALDLDGIRAGWRRLAFEWDGEKAAINRRNAIGFVRSGIVTGRLMITVVHTYRLEGPDEIIRIVSARRADAHERRLYVETL